MNFNTVYDFILVMNHWIIESLLVFSVISVEDQHLLSNPPPPLPPPVFFIASQLTFEGASLGMSPIAILVQLVEAIKLLPIQEFLDLLKNCWRQNVICFWKSTFWPFSEISVAAQQRRCERSKGLVSHARALWANLESNREPKTAWDSQSEPERARQRARESQREPDRAREWARKKQKETERAIWEAD